MIFSERVSKKISIIIVTWNNENTISQCLKSVFSQTIEFQKEVIVVDNASSDDTVELVECWPNIQVIRNSENLGFCAANNQAIFTAQGEFILLLNPDTLLKDNYLIPAIQRMQHHSDVALLTGKILSMNSTGCPVLKDGVPVIDSAGIAMKRNRQAVDIGQGEKDHGQYDQEGEVFGVSAAVCLCRRDALLEVAVEGQVFDEAFFMYKEDVDLSWRLRLRGWECYFTPYAVAYHARGWKKSLARKDVPRAVRFHSYKNHRLAILKNDNLSVILPDLVHILGFELAAIIFVLFREAFLLKAYWDLLLSIPHIRRWRSAIHSRRDYSIREHLYQNHL